MYAQAAIKPNTLLRNGAYGIVMRGVQKCTCAGASLRSRNSAPLCCIKLDTATEPAMGSAAFLNEAINQLAEAYITRKEQETGDIISYDKRFNELQKVKMYIADHNVYGIDLNPVAVELAEVSLWLNTIYEGGYVPWFGTQLINGNSLIGARRQVYSEGQLQTSSKGLRWYENAPERVPLGTERKKRRGNSQIYHFLLGDPGMCSYSDKVIKSLEPYNIKKMKDWNKKFTAAYTDSELESLRQLSLTIDELWNRQIELRQTIENETQDVLSVYGHEDTAVDSHTTIRQKDEIYSKLYKSEHMRNAGPYARLKFAMDYWCSLWFWPIDKAELLPSRSEFLNDLNLILVGTISTGKGQAKIGYDQLSLFDDQDEDLQLIHKINAIQGSDKSEVDLDSLCMLFPRFELVRQIADQNKFMHWELEFADLFAERGGFDLIIGNPPWILLGWNEQDVLSDSHPSFAVKKLSASDTTKLRTNSLKNEETRKDYFVEYEAVTGQQLFLNAPENYSDLVGMKANLFKCFLPQAWSFTNSSGVSAFVHPDGVYDDPKGGRLREKLYSKLRKHFQFNNELKLFSEVDHHMSFSLNVYSNVASTSFETISNLFSVSTIEECYGIENDCAIVPGIKDEEGSWNIRGHKDRIIKVGRDELRLFAKLFDGGNEWKSARLPVLHVSQFVEVLRLLADQKVYISDYEDTSCSSQMWNETTAQKDGTMLRNVHFPEGLADTIFQGPHFGIANPVAKTSRRVCVVNSDYDCVDLQSIPENYIQRVNYTPACNWDEYIARIPRRPNGDRLIDSYRIMLRRMLNQSGERTLISVIEPPLTGHVSTVLEIDLPEPMIPIVTGIMSSVVADFYIRTTGKSDAYFDTLKNLPIPSKFNDEIVLRTLLLNCVTSHYAGIWEKSWKDSFTNDGWAKKDSRLLGDHFADIKENWSWSVPLRSDYSRRQALIEIDVLVAMSIGMTLKQLKTVYRIQFPVLQSYEADTWYDANGRIVFTNNRSLPGVGFDRKKFELEMKDASAGQKFYRTIMDDTMPGGPVERSIEYVAPFNRCDREHDYEIAWEFFEKKYGGK